MKNILQSPFHRFVRFLLSLLILVTVAIGSYTELLPILPTAVEKITIAQNNVQGWQIGSERYFAKGLRVPKINANLKIEETITSEVTYKDVRFLSTTERQFSTAEIDILKVIIDSVPPKIFEYRPWAIISTDFNSSDINNVNPEGVAFSRGPYVYVGDVTFEKQVGFDTGTYRGLHRIMIHEFMHNAQFFETKSVPNTYSSSFLESSDLIKDWAGKTGWIETEGRWSLSKGEKTTEYGRSNPVEDMADAFGSLAIGEEFMLSESRIEWVLDWLELTKEQLQLGTLPFSQSIEQRKLRPEDSDILNKYKDPKALASDIFAFQSTKIISKKDFSTFYANEFKKRGWTGSIGTNGIGELTFQNKYKVRIEMNNDPLRLATIVMNVYKNE